jgi:hypothetical protein
MRTLFIFLIPCVIFGCNEITYPVPQPSGEKNLSTIPEELHGKYVAHGSGGSDDTVAIARNGIFDPNHPNDAKATYALSDSLILRKYKGYYFMNNSEHHNSNDWRVIVIKKMSNGDLETQSMSADDKKFPELIRNVSKVVLIDSTKTNNSIRLYQINPSPQQLMQLVHEGYFGDRQVWKRLK